jgi:hypothetical protein
MSVLSLETLGVDAIFIAALVTAMSCLVYLVLITVRERRRLRAGEDQQHRERVQSLRPGVSPRRRAERVALHETRR